RPRHPKLQPRPRPRVGRPRSLCYNPHAVATVLLLFDSRGGLTAQLADAVAEGVRATPGIPLPHRRLDDAGADELKRCDALILGSPNWSGVTGKLKDWMDHSGDLWETGELAGKIRAAFTAAWARSGGTAATLL